MPIAWDSSYETGHKVIDAQHRALLAVVNELESSDGQQRDSRDVILGVLSHIMDLSLSHFAMEEDLMTLVDYPADPTAEMILQHREFTFHARRRVLEFRRGEMLSVLPLQESLADWLVGHEVGSDKLLAEYIRERG